MMLMSSSCTTPLFTYTTYSHMSRSRGCRSTEQFQFPLSGSDPGPLLESDGEVRAATEPFEFPWSAELDHFGFGTFCKFLPSENMSTSFFASLVDPWYPPPIRMVIWPPKPYIQRSLRSTCKVEEQRRFQKLEPPAALRRRIVRAKRLASRSKSIPRRSLEKTPLVVQNSGPKELSSKTFEEYSCTLKGEFGSLEDSKSPIIPPKSTDEAERCNYLAMLEQEPGVLEITSSIYSHPLLPSLPESHVEVEQSVNETNDEPVRHKLVVKSVTPRECAFYPTQVQIGERKAPDLTSRKPFGFSILESIAKIWQKKENGKSDEKGNMYCDRINGTKKQTLDLNVAEDQLCMQKNNSNGESSKGWVQKLGEWFGNLLPKTDNLVAV